jgi:undecaprenyl diphosphate synthase
VVAKPASPPLPDLQITPRHVAIIMDGNGRWAESRGLTRSEGHQAGAMAIRPVLERLGDHGIPIVTLFGFSTENWGRPQDEVQTILRLAARFIDDHVDELNERGVQLRHLGDLDRLPRSLQRRVRAAVDRTARNNRLIVNVAFNYGGRSDIVEAVRKLVAEGVRPEDVSEEAIAARLATAGLPEPDLLIRTGGDHRMSNFLVWQAAYAECYFTGTRWPDFDAAAVDEALLAFQQRQRRFGLVQPPAANGAAHGSET